MRTIVTGAGSGIGLAVARQLARDPNAQIVLVDRNVERGERNAAELSQSGAQVACIPGEMTDPDVGRSVVAAAMEHLDGLDSLVIAAGTIDHGAPMADLSLEEYEIGFHINTRPLFLIGQAAYPHLKASRGAIVAICSTSATMPVTNFGTYSASKAAQLMVARQMALEWGPDEIRVNTISPGPTATPMASAYEDPAIRRQRETTLPLRRVSEPEDIAATVEFLLGPHSRSMTGSDILIDSGMTLTTMQLSGAALGRATD